MRRTARSKTLAFALLLGACHSYKPLPVPTSVVGTMVRVQFSVPRTLVAARATGGDSVLKLVSTFEGRVTRLSGDTMSVSLLRISDASQDHPAPAALTVTVTPEPSVAIDVLELDGAKTAALVGVPIWVIGSVAAVFAFAALLRYLELLTPSR